MSLSAAADEAPLALEPIIISAPGLSRDLVQTPAAVSRIDAEDLRQARQSLQLDEALNRVPGAVFQNRYNYAQNLRISIRGFGARAPFGVRGIRIRVDGLPETLPDGQSQIDAIDLESVDRIEIIRGPAAAIYGNAAGGVIDIHGAERVDEDHRLELRAQAGSDDFYRIGVRASGESGPWAGYASVWDLGHDGYRAQSRSDKHLAHGRLRYAHDSGRSLTTLLTFLDQPLGQDPGGLTLAEVAADRRQAAPGALALDAGQQVRQQRIGWIYSDLATLPGTISAHAFLTRRDFEQQLPFAGASLIAFDRDFYGVGADYTDVTMLAARPLHYLLGFDAARQRDDRRRFQVDGAGDTVAQLQDARESATVAGLFAQADLALTDRIDLTLGGRLDRIRFEIDDRFTADGTASGRRDYDEFSVSIGAGWQWRPLHRLYANAGTAFETPTFTEFNDPTQPTQGFDPALEPQQAVNLETGIKGMIGPALRYDLALFTIRTRDEIIQIATDPNRYANAARTRRHGLELGVHWQTTPSLAVTAAWTLTRYRFDTFTGEAADPLRGKRLPGLPNHVLFSEVAWRSEAGGYVMADALWLGRRYADNANTVAVADHVVANLRTGRVWRLGSQQIEGFIGINNLTDRDYYSNIRVNAAGARYFEPAPGRNVYAGVAVKM